MLHPGLHPDLLVGMETGDDAAVWRRPDGRALVATVDFFAPIVDDAATWGRVSAANAASDVYAMGGTPLFALNVAAWPRDVLPLDLLGEVLLGAATMAAAGGWIVAGGHTVDGPEPMFGQVVIGELPEAAEPLTNVGAEVGDVLVLTKPLGTGLVATALKRGEPELAAAGGALHSAYTAAVASMTRLNDVAGRAARRAGAHACTDVTGFGLVGHLHKILLASDVGAAVDLAALPRLPGVDALIAAGAVPGGTGRNLEFVGDLLMGGSPDDRTLAADPQTSGGLLVCCPPDAVAVLLRELAAAGQPAAAIGEIVAAPAGTIRLV
jgi:selenide, water dikinase